MRPRIPDQLASRAETAAGEHGYTSTGELIRDALRQRLDELEAAERSAGGQHE